MTLKEKHRLTWQSFRSITSYWYRSPIQFFAVIFGLALATALWSAVQAINSEARASYNRANAQLSLNDHSTITHVTRALQLTDYIELRRAGWDVSPVAQFNLPQAADISVILIDVLSHPSRRTEMIPSGQSSTTGPFIWGHPIIKNKLEALDLNIKTSLDTALPDNVIITDFSQAALLGLSTTPLDHLLLAQDQLPSLKSIDTLIPGLKINRPSLSTDTGTLTESFHLNLTAFGFLSFVVGLFIVHSMINLALEQRRGLFRTLRCLGVPIWVLITALGCEMLLFALIAGGSGIGIGYVLASLLMPGVSGTLQGLYGADIAGVLQLRTDWVLSGLAIAVFGSLLAGARGLYLVAKLPILQSPALFARGQHIQRIRSRGAIMGGALLFLGTVVLLTTNTLIGGFIFLGALMLGTALALPMILSKVISTLTDRAQPGISAWIWSDLRAQLHMLSLPLMALLLAIATNIGVETMTSSFRLTLISWLEQRFTADLYVRLDEKDDPNHIQSWLTDQGTTALPLMTSETVINGHLVSVYGLIDHPFYEENWPLIAKHTEAWPTFHLGQGIMINEQMAYGLDLWPGDQLVTNYFSQPILGVYPDYGNTQFQIVMAQKQSLLSDKPTHIPSFTILLNKIEKQNIINGLTENFGIPQTHFLDQNSLRTQSLAIFDQTFLITNALNVLTLSVAAFALLTSFLSMWSQRLPQIAPIWAMGIPSQQLARYEIIRSLALGALVAILAIPLGLVLAWALLSVINVQAFGWKLPFYATPVSWVKVTCLSILAALLAALIPASRLRSLAPSTLLKVFNNER